MSAVRDIGLLFRRPRMWWPELSLTWQFTVVSSVVAILGLLVQGEWVSSKIQASVTYNSGAAAALYMESVIAPHIVKSDSGGRLSQDTIREIDNHVQLATARLRVLSLTIWTPDGRILYSSNKSIIGEKFPLHPELAGAIGGTIVTNYGPPEFPENEWERFHNTPTLEVYAPVLDHQGRVVAVAEFYEYSEELTSNLARAQREGWLVTGLVFSTMMLALFLIVDRGSNTIDEQRQALAERVSELSLLLRRHDELRGRVEQASRNATEDNERFLRRLGSDLHDGPAQMISLALLRLDSLCSESLQGAHASEVEQDLQTIRAALTDAMKDVRNLCAGLCLPEIEALSLKDALLSSVGDHERRTRTSVSWCVSDLPVRVPHFVKICVYRFIQEALNNAFRHADGKGQRVTAWTEGDMIAVRVEDDGPGLSPREGVHGQVRLGLTGLWDRIESLGGVLEVTSRPNEGTRLTARLPVAHRGPA